MGDDFQIVSPISRIEVIAANLSTRELAKLKRHFGGKRWRKLKGIATVEFADGQIHRAEVHWYECHGVGRRKWKIKRLLP